LSREHDFPRPKREPQNEQHGRDRQHGVERGAVGQRPEFLIGYRDGAGQTDRDAIFRRKPERCGGLADGF